MCVFVKEMVKFIDELAVKRVNALGDLESTTLRSDLVARYLFLNESLLEGVGVVESEDVVMPPSGCEELLRDLQGATDGADTGVDPFGGEYDTLLRELDDEDCDLAACEAKWRELSGKKYIPISETGSVNVYDMEEDVSDMLGEIVDL